MAFQIKSFQVTATSAGVSLRDELLKVLASQGIHTYVNRGAPDSGNSVGAAEVYYRIEHTGAPTKDTVYFGVQADVGSTVVTTELPTATVFSTEAYHWPTNAPIVYTTGGDVTLNVTPFYVGAL